MHVLVTGGCGFVGTHVVEELLAAGHDVRVLDDLSTSTRDHLPDGVELRVGDVADPQVVAAAVAGVDAVSHQAAKVGLGQGVADLADYVRRNDLGTAVLLAALADADVDRLVLASSMVVYGEGGYDCATHGAVSPPPRTVADLERGRFEPACPRCGQPLTVREVGESAPLDPRNGYAATKVAQEHLAATWAGVTGGSAVALRYHNVYGRRLPRDTPYAGVAALFRSALLRGEPPRVFEDGDSCATSSTCATSPWRTGSRSSTRRPRRDGSPRTTWRAGGRRRSARWQRHWRTPSADRRRWSPASSGSATCGTWSPPRPGRGTTSVSGPGSGWPTGWPTSRPRAATAALARLRQVLRVGDGPGGGAVAGLASGQSRRAEGGPVVARTRILLAEDDPTIADVVARYLVRDGHEVEHVTDGPTALHRALNGKPDLVVLDIMLPGLDGLEVCRRLRQSVTTPVVLLTALGAENDRVAGLEVGADDYVTKPFSPRELTLRVRAVLRRARGSAGTRQVGLQRDGDLVVDLGARHAARSGAELTLTTREFDLLAFFLSNPGQVFSRKELLASVWGWTVGDESTVTVHVRRLRGKLEDDPADPRRVLTVWGSGYRYQPQEQT